MKLKEWFNNLFSKTVRCYKCKNTFNEDDALPIGEILGRFICWNCLRENINRKPITQDAFIERLLNKFRR